MVFFAFLITSQLLAFAFWKILGWEDLFIPLILGAIGSYWFGYLRYYK